MSRRKAPAVPLGQHVTVPITWMDDDGQGVGTWQDRTVAVVGALPGDVVEAAVTWSSATSSWTRASLLKTLQPSPSRIPNTCAHAPHCVGCPLRDLSRNEQLHIKQARVERALHNVTNVPPAAVLPAPTQLGYRSRAKWAVQGPVMGAFAPGTHTILPASQCQVLMPCLAHVGGSLEALLRANPLPCLKHVVARANTANDVLMALVVDTPGLPETLALARELRRLEPHVVGVVEHHQPGTGNAIFSREHPDGTVLDGVGQLEEDVAGHPVQVGATAFTQVHHAAGQQLVKTVVEACLPLTGGLVVDAYCGLGAFALAFAAAAGAGRVVGVEENQAAVASATQAAANAGLRNVAFEAGDASAFLTGLANAGTPVDVLVVDPPRKGLTDAGLAAIQRAKPARVAYVACEPKALARDLPVLLEAGYVLERLQPLDLFPQTPEVETFALLRRG